MPRLSSEGETSALCVGTYVLRQQDFRGHNRNPRPASPGSTTEVETSHPLLSCTAMVPETYQLAEQRRRLNLCPAGAGHEKTPVGAGGGRKCAHGGRPAGSGPVLKGRAPPAVRAGSHAA